MIKTNKRRLGSMRNIAALGADDEDGAPLGPGADDGPYDGPSRGDRDRDRGSDRGGDRGGGGRARLAPRHEYAATLASSESLAFSEYDPNSGAPLDADADAPVRNRRSRRERRHDRRSKRTQGTRLMKSWERKFAVHARKESLREARHLLPA